MRTSFPVALGAALFSISLSAGAQVTSSGGTANSIPKYTSPTALTNSALTDASGVITSSETVVVNGGSTGSGTPSFSLTGFQQYGMGIELKIANLTGLPESGSTSAILFTGGNRPSGFAMIQSGGTDYGGGNGFIGFQTTAGGVLHENMRVAPSGNVGIGTTAPGAKLEVDGSIKITSASGGSITYADGTNQTTAWNGVLSGGDYAESIDVRGSRDSYEPGDVIAIDPSAPGSFRKTPTPYSKLVAGVYSTRPGLVGRRATAPRLDKEDEVPMAMMGIVPIKVCAENGPIEPGDLLVSASTPGYAMRGTDNTRLIGAVIGKALARFNSEVGVIEVLISLQ